MNIALVNFFGFTLDVVGKVLVAYTAIMVHYRFWQEHKVDEKVFVAMKRELLIGMLGIVLIIVGYFLQMPSKLCPIFSSNNIICSF